MGKIELDLSSGHGQTSFHTTPGTESRGTINGRLKYSDSRPRSGPCAGKIDYARFKASASLRGSKPKSGKPSVNFDAQAIDINAIDARTESLQKANCNDQVPGLLRWAGEERVIVQGVYIDHPPGVTGRVTYVFTPTR